MDYKNNTVFDYTFPDPLKKDNVNFYENKHITNAKKYIQDSSANVASKKSSTNTLPSNQNKSSESLNNKTFKSQYLNDSGKWTRKAVDDNFVEFDDYINDILDETETYISFNNKPFKVNNKQQNKLPASTKKETGDNTFKPKTKDLDTLSNLLTAASLIPGIDTFTNLVSIPVDLAREDYLSAGLDVVGMIPFVGEIADVSKYVKTADKALDAAKTVNKATDAAKVVDKAADATKVADKISDTAKDIKNISPAKLTRTHKLTLSKKQYESLVESIRKNGIIEPIKHVEHEGTKYVVDGHHRLNAAKQLGLDKIPTQKVSLPYKGYRTIQDLLWFD